ncbi:MAG: hypothetical protein KDD29_09375 [Flavobacteriales bacterium]|nr:hypothetical protein [Flavobacteriales bacterium]
MSKSNGKNNLKNGMSYNDVQEMLRQIFGNHRVIDDENFNLNWLEEKTIQVEFFKRIKK